MSTKDVKRDEQVDGGFPELLPPEIQLTRAGGSKSEERKGLTCLSFYFVFFSEQIDETSYVPRNRQRSKDKQRGSFGSRVLA